MKERKTTIAADGHEGQSSIWSDEDAEADPSDEGARQRQALTWLARQLRWEARLTELRRERGKARASAGRVVQTAEIQRHPTPEVA